MVDTVSSTERSRMMRLVHSKDTRPEMLVRRLVYKLGFRYRLHESRLPGKPDLVFWGRRKVIFVHGCFWHLHIGCARARLPKSRVEFWRCKLEANQRRDVANLATLSNRGWQVLVIWECELGDLVALEDRVRDFLLSPDAI